MIIASGVSKGIGISRAVLMRRKELSLPDSVKGNKKSELARVDSCIREVDQELRNVCDNVLKDRGSQAANIMSKYIEIINNESLRTDIKHKVMEEETSAEHAVVDIMDGFEGNIKGLEDEYLHEKCEDIEEIKLRLLSKLTGSDFWKIGSINHECIIVAQEMTPGDILKMNPVYVKGIVTISAGPTSSVGAIARKLNIPMVTGAGSEGEKINDKDILLVDGDRGRVIINPGSHELSDYGINYRF